MRTAIMVMAALFSVAATGTSASWTGIEQHARRAVIEVIPPEDVRLARLSDVRVCPSYDLGDGYEVNGRIVCGSVDFGSRSDGVSHFVVMYMLDGYGRLQQMNWPEFYGDNGTVGWNSTLAGVCDGGEQAVGGGLEARLSVDARD
jgi:hypothetical protein